MPLKFKTLGSGIDKQKSKTKRTSIGDSNNTYPKNKNAKKQHKKYRGQGK
jgi:hypothetical protein|tara:strand:- start:38 stop:187 length:150 start_codon:yes stop_codon:yes gene_type:complete